MSQSTRILAYLKSKGQIGATNSELNKLAYRYSARIYELRKEGYDIYSEQLKKGLFRYILIEG